VATIDIKTNFNRTKAKRKHAPQVVQTVIFSTSILFQGLCVAKKFPFRALRLIPRYAIFQFALSGLSDDVR